MKSITFLFVLVITAVFNSNAQCAADSLVWFTDLQFHSDFEEKAFKEFVFNRRDTFNLFMSIDPTLTEADANNSSILYNYIYQELAKLKLGEKSINKQIKAIYTAVHQRFLKKYKDEVFFPSVFQTGEYNCVSASILFALVYHKAGIPFKVMSSPTHVYLVANPGKESVVIETTNPLAEKMIFSGDFKQQYVNHLKASKLISEEDLRNKSTEEIYEEVQTQVEESSFLNLIGFQYYNKAIFKAQEENIDEAYRLIQKAYYFYPDPQARLLLQNLITFKIAKCEFAQVSDIDYLAQLSRLKHYSHGAITTIFNNIIVDKMRFSDREAYCDSVFSRLISKMSDRILIEETSFEYFLLMSQFHVNSDRLHDYIDKAVAIKSNHRESNNLFKISIQQRVERIHDYQARLDTIHEMQKKYDFSFAIKLLNDLEARLYLDQAGDLYLKRSIKQAEEMLELFESKCLPPIMDDPHLIYSIESTYQTAIFHYLKTNNKQKASELRERGLHYVPWSSAIKKAITD